MPNKSNKFGTYTDPNLSDVAVMAVVFGLVSSSIAGLTLWLLRLPVNGHNLSLTAMDILRTVALVWSLVLVLPLASKLTRNSVRFVIASQVAFWGMLATFWVLGPVLPFAVDALILIVSIAGFSQLKRCQPIRFLPLLAIVGTAFVVALLHVVTLLDLGYSQPLAVEAALMGQQHKDTLFHASITGFLSQYGVASAGFDGLSPLSYHILAHRLIAALAEWAGVVPLNAYVLFLPIIGGPLLITLLFWTYAMTGIGRRGNVTTAFVLVKVIVLVLFSAEIGIKSFWVSETYIVSLWAFLGALAIMGSASHPSKFNWVLVCGALATLVLVSSLAKISTGTVLACGVAVYIIASDTYRMRSFLAAAVFGILPLVIVSLTAPVDSGHADQPFIVPLATLMRWPDKTMFHILLVIIFLFLAFRKMRAPNGAKPGMIAICTIMLSCIMLSLLIYLEAASALYFANPALWAALCLLPLLGADSMPVQHSRQKIGRWILLSLGLVVVIHRNFENMSEGLHNYRSQINEIEIVNAELDNRLLVEALPLGKIVMAGLSSDGVFVPPNVHSFWRLTTPCWSALQVVPAIAATPMLMGLPASNSDCDTSRYYGFGAYTPELSTQQTLDDLSICLAAAEREMQVVSIVQPDLSFRKLKCPVE